ncbi:MAG: polyphosphate kinase 1 [Leptospiraceae bacterium]|nr:polyphosphate kinase 1 [Leptospiraceae bacterium]
MLELKKEFEEHNEFSKDKIIESKNEISTNNPKKKANKITKNNHLLSINNYDLFFNRELSWLEFNYRVLEEAIRKDNPLLERLKFIAIYDNNMNEFFMVRVAGLKQIVASSINEIQLDGKTAEETLKEIHKKVHQLAIIKYNVLNEILEQLKSKGIEIYQDTQNIEKLLDNKDKKFIKDFFKKELFKILTPLAIDPSHPFPRILNGKLNLAIKLRLERNPNKISYAIVEVPSDVLPRFIELPPKNKFSLTIRRFITVEEIIKLHIKELFGNNEIISIHGFTINRNSELSIEEVSSENLLSTIEEELKNRKWGEAVRLNYRKGMPNDLKDFLRKQLDLKEEETYEKNGMLNLFNLMEIYEKIQDRPDLRDVPFIPRNTITLENLSDIFELIKQKDILLHHPYDSFQPVIDFLQAAATDKDVLAIKQTLYRTSGDSPIVKLLIEAAERGKQVTALVELKARFDEERNIVWAREMEKHGIHVVYGLVGLKIHAKVLQVIRREKDGVRSYVHLSTGNYNPNTAKIYTDLAILTADPEINNDVSNLFHALTGYASIPKFSKISVAPIDLRQTLTKLIEKEIANAQAGKPASIKIKINSLVDADMILLLYKASMAGVKIDLNVRGICCLKPNLPGISENIRVISIVGRFLEHSRIYYFENNGNPKIFLSSADLMPRNLNRRVEILFPIEDPDLKNKIIHILDVIFRDNHNARLLLPDGKYIRLTPKKNEPRFSSQRYFREEILKEFEEKERNKEEKRRSIFQPLTNFEQIIQSKN